MLTLEGISKFYRGTCILEHVDLTLEKGEILCLKGPSGIGKSTLLKIAAGLLLPDSGRAIRSTRNLGYTFQHSVLLPWKTSLKNMKFITASRNLWDYEGAMSILERFGLEQSAWKKPGALSGGMKKRLGIAAALMTRPELLFLDEPFTFLDDVWQEKTALELKRFNREHGTTMLMVSHAPAPVELMEAQIITIDGSPINIKSA